MDVNFLEFIYENDSDSVFVAASRITKSIRPKVRFELLLKTILMFPKLLQLSASIQLQSVLPHHQLLFAPAATA
jgi:hypothetical protein